jgi:hypothetical protein
MPQNIIDTVFPVTQGEGFKPNETPPFSPGPGIGNANSSIVKANEVVPGAGVPAQSFKKTAASVSAPNSTAAGAAAPGVSAANDSPKDDSNNDSGNGPVTATRTTVALGTVDGGLSQPGGVPVSVTQNNVAGQVFQQPGGGLVPTYDGGMH